MGLINTLCGQNSVINFKSCCIYGYHWLLKGLIGMCDKKVNRKKKNV